MSARLGLRWQRTADAIRIFVRKHGQLSPRRAVLCTYGLEPERFRASLLPELMRRGRQFRALVIGDAGALQSQFNSGTGTIGQYVIAPAKCTHGGVFHAKLILLRAGSHYLVGFGSANLTSGGFGSNLELMLFADHTSDQGRRLAGGAAEFLNQLADSKTVLLPRPAKRFLQLVIADLPRNQDTVLHTLEEPLLPQMAALRQKVCGSTATSVSILSPWHSGEATPDQTEPEVVSRIRTMFRCNSPLRIYTLGRNGSGPGLGNNVEVYIPKAELQGGTPSENGEEDVEQACDRQPTNLHAKAYMARGPRGNLFFFGSANCTSPALQKAIGAGGNVELLVASKLTDADVRAFEGDLSRMFAPARKILARADAKRPFAASGEILAGYISARLGNISLEIEAPNLNRGHVTIAGDRNGKQRVQVTMRDGVGHVSDSTALRKLFGTKLPDRSDATWSTLLWECVKRDSVPFPVAIPLAEASSDRPDVAVSEILFEELGWWPATGPELTPEDGDDEPDGADEEEETADGNKDTWTKAVHQGELDRIAVATAMLSKRLNSRMQEPSVRRAYLRLLLERLQQASLEPHIVRELRRFLESRQPVKRRAT